MIEVFDCPVGLKQHMRSCEANCWTCCRPVVTKPKEEKVVMLPKIEPPTSKTNPDFVEARTAIKVM